MKKFLFSTYLISLFFVLGNNGFTQQISEDEICPCHGNPTSLDELQHLLDNYQPQIGRSNLQMPEGFVSQGSSRYMLDSKGTEFWLLYMENLGTPTLYLDITSEMNANGTVSVPGLAFSQNFSVAANTVTRITIPNGAAITTSGTVQSLGVHVVSDNEVSVYGLNYIAFTTDGFLGLPVDILGTSYLILTYPASVVGAPGFAIVSPYDNNQVTIIPSELTSNGNPPGVPINVTLNAGQTYFVRGQVLYNFSADPTGSIVTSTLPVAVFAGGQCMNVPFGYTFCDHIVEQLPPVSTWGQTFVTRPLESRLNGDTWRFLASQNGTQLTINGSMVATLNFGDFYETILTTSSYIVANRPILAVQFSNGSGFSGNPGDPFMMVIPPYQQFLDAYNFSPPVSGYATNYFASAVETAGVSGMKLDGSPLNPANYLPIAATGYSAAVFPVSLNTNYNITNSDGYPSGLYLYGFNTDDSYGYPGGLSLLAINPGAGPVITLTPATLGLFCTALPSGDPLEISALITDPEAPFVQSAILYYRTIGAGTYSSLPMSMGGGNIWSATIPGANVNSPGIEFYIFATDGQVVATSPAIDPSNNPYVLGVDNSGPQIVHTAVTNSPIGDDILISADVTDNTDNVTSVKLYYRKTGGTPIYTVLNMNLTVGDTYAATIPGAQMTSQGIDYYIKATDNYGVSCTWASTDDPQHISPGPGGGEAVPLSNWALYLAISLAVTFVIVRFRKMI